MEQAFTLLTLKFLRLRTFRLPQPWTMSGLFLGLQGTTMLLCVTLHLLPLLSRVSLIKKDTPFIWHDAQVQAFKTLKHAFTQAPVLPFPDYTLPFISRCGVGSVMDWHSPRRDNAGSNPHATTDFSVSAEWPKTTHMLPRRPSINLDSRRTRPGNHE